MCPTQTKSFRAIFILIITILSTSLAHKEENVLRVLEIEQILGKELEHYTETAKLRLQRLKRAADKLHTLRNEGADMLHQSVESPTGTFHLVHELYNLRRDVEYLGNEELNTDFMAKAVRDLSREVAPEDLEKEIGRLFYLQDTYSLTTSELVNVSLHGYHTVDPLDAESCLVLGEKACHMKDLYHGILWLQQALKSLRREDLKGGLLEERALDFLAFALYTKSKEDNLEMALKLTKRLLKIAPGNERARKNVHAYKELLRSRTPRTKSPSVKNKRSYSVLPENVHQRKFERLCQGKYKYSTSIDPNLSCRYARGHPYFLLRPLKEELLSKSPDVYIYHDVLTEEEIREIKEVATPMLKPSTVYRQGKTKLHHDSSRNSLTAWLPERTAIVSKINNKVSAITGFVTAGIKGELIQVVKYSPGQEFEPHRDYADNPRVFEGSGNRVATALFYLNDVQTAGATIIVRANVTVFPEKGALLYWRNLLLSGAGDERTVHAGCPVLVGTKWICTKWIHEYGQERMSRCGLDPRH